MSHLNEKLSLKSFMIRAKTGKGCEKRLRFLARKRGVSSREKRRDDRRGCRMRRGEGVSATVEDGRFVS